MVEPEGSDSPAESSIASTEDSDDEERLFNKRLVRIDMCF